MITEVEARLDSVEFHGKCEVCKDCEGRTALHYAAREGNIQICKFLIEKVKVDIDIKTERGDSSLLLATAMEHINTAKYLIIRGADIRKIDSKGMTSLHYAAETGNKELMQLLLLKGADIEAKSVYGTPLQCAASSGSLESVRFLLGHGAKPNSVSQLSFSPLMWALSCHSSECLELLLKAGADPNLSSCGKSPLAYAAMEGEAELLRSLLGAGANPNSISTLSLVIDNDTFQACLRPIEYAASKGNYAIVRILFPVTQSIPDYPDWSIHGITKYFHSEQAKIKREEAQNAHSNLVKQKGKDAVNRKEYWDAIKWYSEAIYLDSSDARLLSNRSLCWAKLNEAAFALSDAEACVKLRPDWPKAHYREGVAWRLLKNYLMASTSFSKAFRLDPRNKEIEDAFRYALKSSLDELAVKRPLDAERIRQTVTI
ncbi:UNVERIFIED_CONTAM: Serine/threonine-protein phosphatase 5 [Sesamum radiatum]|uniref:Serine/threonine-protein phosphatase 5 n=1 Tax=Sesamum radiatum TaxID=300843 RepID=A0AAW2W2S2_SESRA